MEMLKWVKLLLLACGIYAVYALVKYGNVGGLALPAGIPAWIGVIGIIVIYKLVTWPIKALKYACYFPGQPMYGCGAGPLGGVIWLGLTVALLWLADRYVPGFHEVL